MCQEGWGEVSIGATPDCVIEVSIGATPDCVIAPERVGVGTTCCCYKDKPSIATVRPSSGKSNDWITLGGKGLVHTGAGTMVEFFRDGVKIGGVGYTHISAPQNGLSLRFQLSGLLAENIGPGTYQIRFINEYGASNKIDFRVLSLEPPLPPFINLLSPNGGEWWHRKGTYPITWESNVSQVKIEVAFGGWNDSPLTRTEEGGSQRVTIVNSYPASGGVYNWTIPYHSRIPNGVGTYRIIISEPGDESTNDFSENFFSIRPPAEVSIIQEDKISDLMKLQIANIAELVKRLQEAIQSYAGR